MKKSYLTAKNERKVKRTIDASIGFIGILLIAGTLFAILLFSSSVAFAAETPATTDNSVTAPDQIQNPNHGHTMPLKLRNTTQAQRQDAAKKIKQKAAASGLIVTAPTLVPGPSGLLVPDYFGFTPTSLTARCRPLLPSLVVMGQAL